MTQGAAGPWGSTLCRALLLAGALYAAVGLLLSAWVPLVSLMASATVWVWGAAELLGRNVIRFRVTVSALAGVLPFAGAVAAGFVMACWFGIARRGARRAIGPWAVGVGSLLGLSVLLACGLPAQLGEGAALPVTIALTVLFGTSLATLSFIAVPRPAPSPAVTVAVWLWRIAGICIALFVTLPLGLLLLAGALLLSGWLILHSPSQDASVV